MGQQKQHIRISCNTIEPISRVFGKVQPLDTAKDIAHLPQLQMNRLHASLTFGCAFDLTLIAVI